MLPAAVVAGVPLAWLALAPPERSALFHRAVVALGLVLGLASVTDRLPLDPSAYAALGATLLLGVRRRLGAGLLLAAVLGAVARGDLEVHQRPVLVGGVVAGVLAGVVGTVVWQLLDPLPAAEGPAGPRVAPSRRAGWAGLFSPSPVDLDHLDAIIDGEPQPSPDQDPFAPTPAPALLPARTPTPVRMLRRTHP